MILLGIDTILHSLCAAVVVNGKVTSNIVRKTQMRKVDGLLVKLAQINARYIGKVIDKALLKAGVDFNLLSLIAVSNESSLFSNGIIGVTAGNVLASQLDIPIIGVSHQIAHLFSNLLERDRREFQFPILVFSASAGHHITALIKKNWFDYEIIDQSKGVEDGKAVSPKFVGVGAMFGEVLILLERGNNEIKRINDGKMLADLAKHGNQQRFDFFSEYLKKNTSFYKFDCKAIRKFILPKIKSILDNSKSNNRQIKYDLALAFENFIAQLLGRYIIYWSAKKEAKEIHLVGGISANSRLRNHIMALSQAKGFRFKVPIKSKYSTDNAAMIAQLGLIQYQKNMKKFKDQRIIDIKSDFVLEQVSVKQILKNRSSCL